MKSNTYLPDEHSFLRCLHDLAGLSKRVYTKGMLPTDRCRTVAIIGTRRPTLYGTKIACDFAEKLARRGVVIVSGLAYGIDTAAHRGALQAGGTTIAVMAHGLDRVYPAGNQRLANDILANGGALLSPYEEGTSVQKFRFLERNQWVAGLADAVIVIEAEERSGTKATVRYALDQGKEVFAVPGPITSPQSCGPNQLIKEGAHLALSVDDILAVIAPELLTAAIDPALERVSPEARQLYDRIAAHPQSLDTMVQTGQWTVSTALSLLTILELEGLVTRVQGTWQRTT
jgi:DNA processing protein